MLDAIWNPTVFIPLLGLMAVWIVSRPRPAAKLPALTDERRAAVLLRNRFETRHAHIKARAGAAAPANYGPLTPDQQLAYREMRERMKKAA